MRLSLKPLKLLAAVCCLYAAQIASAEPAATSTSSAASTPAPAANDCTTRYFLYSIQNGEGFSLRRDAFARASVSLLESKHHATTWTLVLPPLSSFFSPHWGQGIQHSGVNYRDRQFSWRSIFDLDGVTEKLGLRYIEYAEFIKERHAQLSPSTPAPTHGEIDALLHLCNFNYSPAFFEYQNAARIAGRLHPGSTHPRDQLFREFTCIGGGKPDPKEGFCGTPIALPQKNLNGPGDTTMLSEYGQLWFTRPGKDAFHCGLSNLQPGIFASILEEHLAPAVPPLPSGAPQCAIAMTNLQLAFWPGRPWPGNNDMEDPGVRTHAMRDRFLTSLRLEKKMREIAQVFIERVLQARPALIDHDSASQYMDDALAPGFLAFHVRRGDFRQVHRGLIPGTTQLVRQILRKYRAEVKRAQENKRAQGNMRRMGMPQQARLRDAENTFLNPLAQPAQLIKYSLLSPPSHRIFISSDMDATEWRETVREIEREEEEDVEYVVEEDKQGEKGEKKTPAEGAPSAGDEKTSEAPSSSSSSAPSPSSPPDKIELVRFDLDQVKRDLRPYLSKEVNDFFDASEKALEVDQNGQLKHPPRPDDVVPLTPIHVLLIDQYICSQAFGLHGFIGSRHSYVSEMIWNQRRAHGLEDVWAQEKQTLDGASQLTKGKKREPTVPYVRKPPSTPEEQQQQQQQQHQKDEL